MKRSEFIKKLTDLYTSIPKDMIPEYRVSQLVKEAERLGMSPPYWVPNDHGYTYGDTPSGEPNGFKIGVRKWEPEE